MAILGAQSLYKSFGDRDILRGASVTIAAGEKLGLVGINGSGKSTLARILADVDQPDGGEVARGREISCAYLHQAPQMDPDSTPVQVALSGLTAWSEAMALHEAISVRMGDPAQDMDRLLQEQADAAADIERLGGWDLAHQAESILGHLGVVDMKRAVGTMSGGERRRVAIARLLVSRPDVAILDEPTNHLDIPTIEWLEQYLVNRFDGALLVITHDRYLLDSVVSRTLELDHGQLFAYQGGWSEYLEARAQRAAQDARVEANRKNFLRREIEWLRRQPKARTGKQKARISRANAAIDTAAPTVDGKASIRVGGIRSGKTVLAAQDLDVEIAGIPLVEGLTLNLGKGERIGIVGPNGAGKTTLLRALLGELEPAAGTVTIGKNTRIAYLDQTRAGIADDESVFDNVSQGASHVTLGEENMTMRSYLRRFLFDESKQKQLAGTLSGGERARVALARVLREGANLVVLDEPTNDLDVTTLSALEASLLDFGGTVLVVTHDRWFLDRIATSILAFEGDRRVVHVQGNYGDYLTYRERDRQEKAEAEAEAAKRAAAAPVVRTVTSSKARKALTYGETLELEKLMPRIEIAEAEVESLEAIVGAADFSERAYDEQAGYFAKLEEARTTADALVERWSDLESRQE